jgi:hypothetical protein
MNALNDAGRLLATAIREMADACENAAPDQEASMLTGIADLLARQGGQLGEHISVVRPTFNALLAAGACESAILALIPSGAVFTGGRLSDGTCIAQVVLAGRSGAHSRNAKTLPLAWAAALLRSSLSDTSGDEA